MRKLGDNLEMGARAISKRAVTSSISNAALLAFSERGVNDVSVEDIARGAGVSVRTFYRYFASKDDVVLMWMDEIGPDVRGRFDARPLEEPLLASLRQCLQAFADLSSVQRTEFQLLERLIADSSSLRVATLQRWVTWEQQLSDRIAMRLGVDARTSHVPNMYAAFAMAGLRFAWGASVLDNHESYEARLDEFFELAGVVAP